MEKKPNPSSAETSASDDDEDKDSETTQDKASSLGRVAFKPERSKSDSGRAERPKAEVKPETNKKPEKETEVPLEQLAEVEKAEVIQSLAQERAKELPTPRDTEALTEQGAAELAAAVYISHAEAEGDPEAALQQAAAELGLDIEATEVAPDEEPEAAAELLIDPHQPGEGEFNIQSMPEAVEEDDSPAANPLPSAGGSGSGRPPVPPSAGAPSGSPSSFGGFGPALNPRAGAPNPNNAPNPATISVAESLALERRAAGRGLLVGGIVGYLLGRRRGRIKTEKRLIPVQNKLEEEVKTLQDRLAANEDTIRRAARAKQRVEGVVRLERTAPYPEQVRARGTESQKPALFLVPPERIGKVLIAAEAAPILKSNRPERIDAKKQAESLSRAELLALSERIVIDGASLRQVYETHLVSEKGLRRIVAEHLRGGNVRRSLRRELVEREIDFERDPLLRDRARSSVAGSGKTVLHDLLVQAGALAVGEDEQQAVLESRAAYQKTEVAKQKRQHVIADVSLISIIAILIALIIMLLLHSN